MTVTGLRCFIFPSQKMRGDSRSWFASFVAVRNAGLYGTVRFHSQINQHEIEAVRKGRIDRMLKRKIYCEGSLLEAVQTMKLYKDSKHFVDMPLKHDAGTILAEWDRLRVSIAGSQLSEEVLRSFMKQHFDEPEDELIQCPPSDWEPRGDLFKEISDDSYRLFAVALHRKWPMLNRRISDKVRRNPERYSIISVPNSFIVPGGRFREMYYWDSFFTIKGLIASGMLLTVRGMIENMQYLIEEFGFVPNGNRVYYLNRSQPPLLTWCVHAYYQASKDEEFVRGILPTLRKEFDFFHANRTVIRDGWVGPLFQYKVAVNCPRPESYREDLETAEIAKNDEDRHRIWGDIAAAAESGLDFSSKWFSHSGENALRMQSIRTSQVVPVDLNAIICGNLTTMGELYDVIGDVNGAKFCAHYADHLRRTIHQVLWNEDQGSWFDFDLETGVHSPLFHISNYFPMVSKATHEGFDTMRVVSYLRSAGVLEFPGGVPTTLIPTGQQWDFPNAWAPTSWALIEGLRIQGDEDLSFALAEQWIRTNYEMWMSNGGRMFEKYDASSPSWTAAGGGGEYEVQEGFGWTNGVQLDLILRYSNRLSYVPADQIVPSSV